ncbi:MAG: MFS transporter [Alphaproteobacteria bacterium]|nr:MFS transporter [Pseudomonadota bacterium]
MAASMDAVWLRRIKSPGAETIAILFGLEALARGTASAVLPIDTVRLLGSDEAVSLCVLAGSAVAIPAVFAAPYLARRFGRASLLSLSCVGGALAAVIFALDLASTQVLGFVLRALGVALVSVCLNLFVMDYVRRGDLGRSEPMRMLSLGIGWFVGPMIGVGLAQFVSPAAPYYFSAGSMLALMLLFWALRFKSAPGVRPTANRTFNSPLANLGVFLSDRRLLHAWLNASGRGFFWMSFFIYTPIYAVNTGLGEVAAGVLLSLGAGWMMAMPVWGWLARRFGIRTIASLSFGFAALGCLAAWGFAGLPLWGAAGIMMAALAMSVNDGYGNALFFRACRPSRRTEMTPAFTTYRDVAEISHAILFAILLIFLPIQIVYLVLALILGLLAVLSRTIHPRL